MVDTPDDVAIDPATSDEVDALVDLWVDLARGQRDHGSHLLADALTPAGIEPLWPVSSKNYSLELVTADSVVGNYALLALGVFVTVALLLVAGPVR